MSRNYIKIAEDYCKKVINKEIIACDYVIRACQRQVDDLKKDKFRYKFDKKKAVAVCEFIELMPHVKGEWANRNELLKLEPWQIFILTTIFGWVDNKGLRRFRTAYTEIPRKNAKSSLSSAVALYMLACDREQGAEVYSAATTRDQATIVFGDAQKMVKKCPEMTTELGVKSGANAVFKESSNSKFKPLSKDLDGNLDGLNIHCAIVDELHGHKDPGLWDVLMSGTGARSQPLIWAITTAGSNRAGICYEQRDYVIKILRKIADDDTYFGIIYTIDDGDDWTLESSWRKANPNFGISVNPEQIKNACSQAQVMSRSQNNFLTKHLNVWVNADSAWMNLLEWDKAADEDLDLNDFKNQECIIGVDLASKTDISASCKLFTKKIDGKNHYYAFWDYFLPDEAFNDSRSDAYSVFKTRENLILTPGTATDFDYIEEKIINDFKDFKVLEVAFDPWQSTQMAQHLAATNNKVKIVEVANNIKNFSEAMKEIEALVLSGRFHFNGDPIITWMISNVVCYEDARGNIYPKKDKNAPGKKIDGVIALIMAMARYINNIEEKPKKFQMFIL